MPTEIRMWNVGEDGLRPIPAQKLDLESRLEEWIRSDPTLVSNDLLVIGQQVDTDYRGRVDLLGIDPEGNLVIMELKRDKTPRDIVAQILDYGSWVEQLSAQQIQEIAEDYLKSQSLEVAFCEKFQTDTLPEVLNERHRMYIVASQLDAATERIVKFLSETHDVDINIVTFAFFKTATGETLCRSFLLDEDDVASRAERRSKRQPTRTWQEIEALADQKNVSALYNKALQGLKPFFDSANRTVSGVSFGGYLGEEQKLKALLGLRPARSSEELGLTIKILLDRLCQYFGIPEDTVRAVVGTPDPEDDRMYHFDSGKLDRFIVLLKQSQMKQQGGSRILRQQTKEDESNKVPEDTARKLADPQH